MSAGIDLTPTWRGILPLLLALLRHGTDEGQREAEAELQRMATVADLGGAYQGALKLIAAIPVCGNSEPDRMEDGLNWIANAVDAALAGRALPAPLTQTEDDD